MAPIYLGKMVVPSSLRYIENLALKMSVLVLSPNLCCRTAELTNIPNRHAQLLGTHASHFLIMLCMKISACMQRSSLICNFKDRLLVNWRTLIIMLHIAQEFYQNMHGHSFKSLQNKQISNNWFEQRQSPCRHFSMKHLILQHKGVDTCMISTFRRWESSIFQCLCPETRHINGWW